IPKWKTQSSEPELGDDEPEPEIVKDYRSEQIELNPRFNKADSANKPTVNSVFGSKPLHEEKVPLEAETVVDRELSINSESKKLALEEDDEIKESPDLAVEEVVEER